MKISKFENKEDWMIFRKGKITGSRLKDIVSSGGATKEAIVKELEKNQVIFDKKLKKEDLIALLTPEQVARLEASADKKTGFYEIIAERLSIPEDEFEGYIPNETPMDRGTRLEKFALERFISETGHKIQGGLIMWSSDENNDISVSPDGVISVNEAVEVKCLSSAKHIEAFLTQKIPDEYKFQVMQYFIVNDKLKKLHFVFYDPRIPAKEFFVIEIKRVDISEDIKRYKAYQLQVLEEVDEVVSKLINF